MALSRRRPWLRNGPINLGWGARIRTWEWRNQNPLPYHLATPQLSRLRVPASQYRTSTSRSRASAFLMREDWLGLDSGTGPISEALPAKAFPEKVDPGFPIGNATNIESRALSGHDPCSSTVNLNGKRSRAGGRLHHRLNFDHVRNVMAQQV